MKNTTNRKKNDNDGEGKANYNDSTLDDIEDEVFSNSEYLEGETAITDIEDEVFSNSEDLEGETAISDIEEDETSSNECPLCRDSTQHHCRKCGKLVCILFCSIMDPRSDNELHVIHKPDDIRCTVQNFECPNCGKTFASPSELQEHIGMNHTQEPSLSLLSEAGSEIERLLAEENETFSSVLHISKRTRQNLKNVDYGGSLDEGDDWDPTPAPEDVELFSCIECNFTSTLQVKLKEHVDSHRQHTKPKKTLPKRKWTVEYSPPSKKSKADKDSISCEICGLDFSRKDNLKRHMSRIH